MPWDLRLARSAEKALDRAPGKDRERIVAALHSMRENPFGGDIARLEGQPTAWRRRVGHWRILFDVHPAQLLIVVAAIRRRTSTTY